MPYAVKILLFSYLFEIVNGNVPGSLSGWNWNEKPALSGYEFTQNILFATETAKFRCALTCSGLSTCISWTHNGARCRGYTMNFDSLVGSVSSIGARYYYDLIRVSITDQDCTYYESIGLPSGIYTIYPKEIPVGVDVFCDIDTASGGWTVIQRRIDGTENFYRDWTDYKNGFGNVAGEYWLGNDNIHLLTKNNDYKVRFNLEDNTGATRYAEYTTFIVNNEADKYRLTVSGYSGTAGDSTGFSYNNGAQFSTMDNSVSGSCPTQRKSGWWHKSCTWVNPNGLWTPGVNQWPSMMWNNWQSKIGMKKVSIKLQKK